MKRHFINLDFTYLAEKIIYGNPDAEDDSSISGIEWRQEERVLSEVRKIEHLC